MVKHSTPPELAAQQTVVLQSFMGKVYEVPHNAASIKQDGSQGKPMWFKYAPVFRQGANNRYQWEKKGVEGMLWGYCGDPLEKEELT